MTGRWMVVASCILGLTRAGAAQAPGTVEIGGFGILHSKTVPMDALHALGAGGRLGVWLPAHFSVEAELDWSRPRNSETANRFTLWMYQGSLLYNVPFADRNSVSFRLGYGKLRPRAGCTVDGGTACPRFGAIVGGVGARVAVSSMFAIRGETFLRSRSSYDFTSVGLTLGVSALLGRAGSDPRADLDDDLDGVLNRKDKCPGTVRGALVDVRGCATDSDGDGVLDGIDRCPATPKGTPVDRFGCPIRRPE